jgi:ribonuclease HII
MIDSTDSAEPLEARLHAEGYQFVAGVDEAGRGCLAGPVVAAAVIFPVNTRITGVDDSKRLTADHRENLLEKIQSEALCVTTRHASPRKIEEVNILQAALHAMQGAVAALEPSPDFILIDGNHAFPTVIPHRAVVKGDSRSHVVSAASIVAKVLRDRHMVELGQEYPEYGWARHKGYPTAAHYEAIAEHGPSPHHRRTFRLYKD